VSNERRQSAELGMIVSDNEALFTSHILLALSEQIHRAEI
jgi:hypothetical protein